MGVDLEELERYLAQRNEKNKKENELKDEEPERKRSDKVKVFSVIAIAAITAVISICLLALKRPSFSDIEQRRLKEFPSFSVSNYFSGDFTAGITEFYNDTVPYRDTFKKINSNIVKYAGFKLDGVKIYTVQKPAQSTPVVSDAPEADAPPDEQDSVSAATPAPAPAPSDDDFAEAGGYSTNGTIVYKDRAMELFGGSSAVALRYAGLVNTYKEKLGAVNVYSMVTPVEIAYYCPKNFASLTQQPKEIIDVTASGLVNVTDVSVYEALEAHKSEYIYLRTDHHWSALGAYYAAEVFARRAGVYYAPLASYTSVTRKGYLGSLYGSTQAAELLNNPDDFTYYKPSNEYSVQYYDKNYAPINNNLAEASTLFFESYKSSLYSIFLGDDSYAAEIKTDVKNGRKLCIVKDSFGRAIVPFLTSSFEEIYVIDPRFFGGNAIEYMQEKGVTDVLFIACAFQVSSSEPVGNSFTDNIEFMLAR